MVSRWMPVPDDPAAFIAAAEHGINTADLDMTAAVYADDALLEAITDGALETYSGAAEIRRGWATYLGVLGERGFRIQKRLKAVDEDTICNEWTGTLGGRTLARGLETWTFDGEGKVRAHYLCNYLNVKSARSPLMRLRLLLTYPLTALAFFRHQRG